MNETSGMVPPKRGVQGRPIRKRGYHRALKRKEPWALIAQAHKEIMWKMMESYNKIMHDSKNGSSFIKIIKDP